MNDQADALATRLGSLQPKIAIILGSGLGNLVRAVEQAVHIDYADLPGFPRSGVSGHAGEVVGGLLGGAPVLMLSGRTHYYEKGDAAAMRPALQTLAGLGVTTLIVTNAAGSLDPDMPPGSVMMIEDHINLSGANPLIGEASDRRFVDLTEAYDGALRSAFEAAAEAARTKLNKGIYLWFPGPSFETPAEIRMARTLGASAVGMSTVPEVILARFLGLRVLACSVITNFAAGMSATALSHQQTKDMAPVGGARLADIVRMFLSRPIPPP